LIDRYRELGSIKERFVVADPRVGTWSLAGAAIAEIDATLLTVRLLQ
jgi:hypothetical protein